MMNRTSLTLAFTLFLVFGLATFSAAETPTPWTPKMIYSLKGKVLKKQVAFSVELLERKFKMVGFFYYKVDRVYGCLHLKERKLVKLCLLRKNLRGKPLQTAIHGLTYNHRYWDSQKVNGQSYSYARFMARRGFIVLALDLLGSGKSDVPNGDELNLDESVSSIAQVLFSLKSGQNPLRHSFKKVILVGHSLGSILSVATLGTFPHAADALVVTGWAWAPHVVLPESLITAILASPNPYVQIPSQLRENLFYFLPKSDPSVIRFDNQFLADQTPRGIFRQGLPLLTAIALGNDLEFIKSASRSNQIRVPVFVQLGEFDVIAPSRLAGQEAAFYPNASKITVQSLSDIGHAFNLHLNNRMSWRGVKRWLDQEVY